MIYSVTKEKKITNGRLQSLKIQQIYLEESTKLSRKRRLNSTSARESVLNQKKKLFLFLNDLTSQLLIFIYFMTLIFLQQFYLSVRFHPLFKTYIKFCPPKSISIRITCSIIRIFNVFFYLF